MRLNCPMIVRPYWRSQSQTISTNASRPSSCRVLPSVARCFSTAFCVEMPAWSYPVSQAVSKPRIRCQRTSASDREICRAWPVCSAPVTFGGGWAMTKGSRPLPGSAP